MNLASGSPSCAAPDSKLNPAVLALVSRMAAVVILRNSEAP